MKKNNYQNENELYNACLENRHVGQLLKESGLKSFSKDFLEKIKVKKRQGYYSKHQITLTIKPWLKKELAFKEELKSQESFDFIEYIDLKNEELKNFLLLTLSKKFQAEIALLRQKHKIPKDGLSLENDDYKEWFWKRCGGENAKKIIKEEYMKDANWFRGGQGFSSSKAIKCPHCNKTVLSSPWKDFLNLCLKYKVTQACYHFPYFPFWGFNLTREKLIPLIDGVNLFISAKGRQRPFLYIKRDVNLPVTTIHRDEVLPFFARKDEIRNSFEEKPLGDWIQPPDNLFQITIPERMSMKKFKEYLKKNAQVLDEKKKKFYKTVQNTENFKRDFLIYNYHLAGKKYTETVKIMNAKYDFNIKADTAKKAVEKLKKRIKELEKR